MATSITPNGNTRGSKRPKEGITVTTSPLKRRKKVVASRVAQRGGAKGAIWRAPVILGGRAVIFFGGGGMASHFSGKIFLVFGQNTIPKYHVKRKEMKKLSMGMSVGEVMKGPPQKIFLGPLKSSGQPWFLVAVTVQYSVHF